MDKKLRRQKWSQCHAWDKKYQLFGTGESAVLIYKEGQEGSTKKAAAEAAAVTNAETAAAAEAPKALDQAVLVSHAGRVFEDLYTIHIDGGHCKAKTFRARVKANFGKSIPEKLLVLFVECCPQCTLCVCRRGLSADSST